MDNRWVLWGRRCSDCRWVLWGRILSGMGTFVVVEEAGAEESVAGAEVSLPGNGKEEVGAVECLDQMTHMVNDVEDDIFDVAEDDRVAYTVLWNDVFLETFLLFEYSQKEGRSLWDK